MNGIEDIPDDLQSIDDNDLLPFDRSSWQIEEALRRQKELPSGLFLDQWLYKQVRSQNKTLSAFRR